MQIKRSYRNEIFWKRTSIIINYVAIVVLAESTMYTLECYYLVSYGSTFYCAVHIVGYLCVRVCTWVAWGSMLGVQWGQSGYPVHSSCPRLNRTYWTIRLTNEGVMWGVGLLYVQSWTLERELVFTYCLSSVKKQTFAQIRNVKPPYWFGGFCCETLSILVCATERHGIQQYMLRYFICTQFPPRQCSRMRHVPPWLGVTAFRVKLLYLS